MRNALLLLALSPLLMGCLKGGGVTCPPLYGYSKTFLDAAAEELESVRDTKPHLAKMLTDYGLTREAIRECRKARRK